MQWYIGIHRQADVRGRYVAKHASDNGVHGGACEYGLHFLLSA
jgi:hypothetical protein